MMPAIVVVHNHLAVANLIVAGDGGVLGSFSTVAARPLASPFSFSLPAAVGVHPLPLAVGKQIVAMDGGVGGHSLAQTTGPAAVMLSTPFKALVVIGNVTTVPPIVFTIELIINVV